MGRNTFNKKKYAYSSQTKVPRVLQIYAHAQIVNVYKHKGQSLESEHPAENGSSSLHCTLSNFGREKVNTLITPSIRNRQARVLIINVYKHKGQSLESGARHPSANGSSNLHGTLWNFGRGNVNTLITPSICNRQARFL